MQFSHEAFEFHGRMLPEEGAKIVGYAAIIHVFELKVPMPETIALISTKNRKYKKGRWNVFTPKYQPSETLYKQLVFALKYEGVNLLFFKQLFLSITAAEIIAILQIEPTGQYSRKIWFLYEWLRNDRLEIPNASVKVKYAPLLDENMQYAIKGKESPRHRIINNLPGTLNFCPLIFKTEKLENYISSNLSAQKNSYLDSIHKDIMQRAAAFLLLKDSKASFTIEGESPKNKRAARWGQAIGQAGVNTLSLREFLRLQSIVIENDRFVKMGLREQGGFIGEHDRVTGEPIPDHISAKWEDASQLVKGLLATNEILMNSKFDAVLSAASIAFGFVFIHPFVDGNGRIHRYLIHHLLARKKFSNQGVIFPISASILDNIEDYRKVLESYSKPLLTFIEWKETKEHNIEVLNETIDYYRYFDATLQAEFLFDCVADTVNNIIPAEISYLQKYDEFKRYLDDEFEMPDKMVATLVRFLNQNKGKLSKRARSKEFKILSDEEVQAIELNFEEVFLQE